jgi:ribosomal protein S18 acetylase RimI-like enzyme
MMNIRLAIIEDIEQVFNLRLETSKLLKLRNIDQWQYENPSRDTFLKDIEKQFLYVLEENQEIIAMASIISGLEPTYESIKGKWLIEHPYLTIHRLAVKKEYLGKNIASMMLLFAEDLAKKTKTPYIRIDTHKDNIYAIRLFQKHQYIYRGIILLEPQQGSRERLAFDKWIGG